MYDEQDEDERRKEKKRSWRSGKTIHKKRKREEEEEHSVLQEGTDITNLGEEEEVKEGKGHALTEFEEETSLNDVPGRREGRGRTCIFQKRRKRHKRTITWKRRKRRRKSI